MNSTDNIFEYEGDRKLLVDIFYNLLKTGKEVRYQDVLAVYDGGEFSESKLSSHPLYNGVLKKVGPELIKTMKNHGYTVLSCRNGRAFQYVGSDPDPLRNIRFKALLTERYKELQECIENDLPVVFKYHPFNRAEQEITLHPHILHEYNNRLFVLGVSVVEGKEPKRCMVFALDRIVSEIRGANSRMAYIAPEPDEYVFLRHVVGVKPLEGAQLTTIRLRALTKKMFGYVKTKPIHPSQKVVLFPDWNEKREYGEFELTVYPTIELEGAIRYYGSELQVVSPEDFKEKFIENAKATLSSYSQNGSE